MEYVIVIVFSKSAYLRKNRLQSLGVLLVLLVYRSVYCHRKSIYVQRFNYGLTVVMLKLIMNTVVDVLDVMFREATMKVIFRSYSPSSSEACNPCMIPSS